MSLPIIIQFAALAVMAGIGVCIVYVVFEMRTVYGDHRDKFIRAVSAIEEFHKLQPEFLAVIQRIESDGHALQKIAIQIEVSVAALKNVISASVNGAAERQMAAIEDLRQHLETNEARLAETVERLAETIRSLSPPALPLPAAPSSGTPEPLPAQAAQPENGNGDYVRLRRDMVAGDSQLRFSLLKEWISVNTLAIQRRAARGWSAPADLIANVPAYLEPEAEIVDEALVVGTRGNPEKLSVSLRDLDYRSGAEPVYSRM